MELRNKSDGTFIDSSDNVVTRSINMDEGHTRILAIQKDQFVKFLDESNYGIIWKVIGEKAVLGDVRESWKDRLAINGVYKMVNGQIRGKSKTEFFNRSYA